MYNQTKVLPPIVNQQLLPAVTADTSAVEKSIQQAYSGTVVLPTTNIPTATTNVPLYSFQPAPQQTQVIAQQPQVVTQSQVPRIRIWEMLVPMQVPQPMPAPAPVPVPEPVTIPEPVVISEPVTIPEPVTISEPVTIPEPVEYVQTYEEPTPVYEEPTYTIPETTTTYQDYQFQSTGPSVQILRRGSGITLNEQNNIISCASNIYQNKILPLSNKTAQAVKKALGGDWLVIVYEQGKPIDFNMTCVQGNDYLYFTLDNMAFQVCRLR